MRGYDYIFYRTTCYYKRKYPESSSETYGVMLVSMLQIFSVVEVVGAPLLVVDLPTPTHGKLIGGILALALFEYNNHRYTWKLSPFLLEERWGSECIEKRHWRGRLIVLYIGVSVTLLFALAILRSRMYR